MKTVFIFTWLFLIFLATSWFFLTPGMFYLHDYLHTARVAEVVAALQDGHFPVRWSENFGYGYGMPLFEFYAPLPFYVGAVLALIGIPLLTVTKLLFVICNLGTTVGSYFLGKSFYGRIGGLLTAAAISLAPYRAVNLYVRGALSESWGVMAIIWIIYFLWQSAKGRKNAWVGLTISLVVLFLSHNLLTLIFLPFSLGLSMLFFGYQYFKNNRTGLVRNVVQTIVAYVLSFGISAFYVLPAYFEKGFTQVEKVIVGGYFDYSIHFLYVRQFFTPSWGYGGSNWGPEDDISFFLGYGQILALAVSLIVLLITGYFWLSKTKSTISKSRVILTACLAVLFFVSLALTTAKTTIIWSTVSLLQFVQFPWRFLSISLVLLGMVAPFFLLAKKSFIKRWLLGFVMVLLCFANMVYFRPQEKLIDATKYYSGDSVKIQTELSKILPDYLPTNVPADTIEYRTPPTTVATCDQDCQITVEVDKVNQKTITVQSETAAIVTLSTNYFPGWVTTINDVKSEAQVNEGLISLGVPAGVSQVTAEFSNTPLRQATDVISLIACILFIGLYIYQMKTNHER